jgi:hypothetical protein
MLASALHAGASHFDRASLHHRHCNAPQYSHSKCFSPHHYTCIVLRSNALQSEVNHTRQHIKWDHKYPQTARISADRKQMSADSQAVNTGLKVRMT